MRIFRIRNHTPSWTNSQRRMNNLLLCNLDPASNEIGISSSLSFNYLFVLSWHIFPNKLFKEFSQTKILVYVPSMKNFETHFPAPYTFICVNLCTAKSYFLYVYVLIGLKIVIYFYFIHYIFHFCYLKRRHNGTHERDVFYPFAIRLLRIIIDKKKLFKSTIVDDIKSPRIKMWYG